jgi:hypothetical protein
MEHKTWDIDKVVYEGAVVILHCATGPGPTIHKTIAKRPTAGSSQRRITISGAFSKTPDGLDPSYLRARVMVGWIL